MGSGKNQKRGRIPPADGSTKPAIISEGVGRLFTAEEIDIQMARLTSAEQDTFMMLLAKMQGR